MQFACGGGNIAVALLTNGVHKGITVLVEVAGVIVYAIVTTIIYILLILIKKQYRINYLSRTAVNLILTILVCGIFNEYVVNYLYAGLVVILFFIAHFEGKCDDYNPIDLNKLWNTIIQNLKEKFVLSVMPCLMVSISYIMLGPFELFAGNSEELDFSYTDFEFALIGLAVALTVVLSGLISQIGNTFIHRIVVSAIFIFGILSYLQNMFLNIQLYSEDGGPIDYDAIRPWIIFDTLFWALLAVAIAIVLIIRKNDFFKIIVYSSFVLSLIQVIAVISLFITVKTSIGDRYFLSGDNELAVAKDENVILLVLDSFGAALLDEAIDNYPDLLDDFSDFTYYEDTSGVYPGTYPSMIHMLTGYNMKGNVTHAENIKTAWNTEDCNLFYQIMHENLDEVRLLTEDPSYYMGNFEDMVGKIDNVQKAGNVVDVNQIRILLLRVSAYKYMPYIVKKNFETFTWQFRKATGANLPESSTDYYYRMLKNSGLYVDNQLNSALIIKCLAGMHVTDYYIDEKMQINPDASIAQRVKANVILLSEYINQLKKLGVYDKATIIITADHGLDRDVDNVILFVKRANERHDKVVVNSAPIDHDDLMATIVDVVSDYEWKTGKPYWEYGENELRKRYRYVYNRKAENTRSYLKYEYEGKAKDFIEKFMKDEYIDTITETK